MDLLVNDLSIHGQFPDIPAFEQAMVRIMRIRLVAKQFGRELHCHRNIAGAKVIQSQSMQQVIGGFDRDQRIALMQWLTRLGPFWEDMRSHSPDDYVELECNGDIVTDTAVAEAALRSFYGAEHHLVSLTPSSWEYSPIPVIWRSAESARNLGVINHWTIEGLQAALQATPAPLTSWEQLEELTRARCSELTFTDDSFEPLRGSPFVAGAADRLVILLEVLNRFKAFFDEKGERTLEGQRLYQDHFTGGKSWFSDSSDTEKHDFQKDLMFRVGGGLLFCPWHGKVKSPQLRIHFSMPVRADEPLYVVYVGPKITKR